MKKISKILIAAAAAVLMLTSCQSKDTEVKEISVSQLADDMLNATTVVAELVEMNDNNIELLYSAYNSENIEEYKVYACASKATCEEIAVFKAKTEDNVNDVKGMVEQRVEDLITETRDYNPAEMPKLENPLIMTKGQYVALVLADDTSKAEEAFEEAFK